MTPVIETLRAGDQEARSELARLAFGRQDEGVEVPLTYQTDTMGPGINTAADRLASTNSRAEQHDPAADIGSVVAALEGWTV